MRYENVNVDIQPHRWYVNIDFEHPDGTVEQWVAAGGGEFSGVFWGTKDDYDSITEDW